MQERVTRLAKQISVFIIYTLLTILLTWPGFRYMGQRFLGGGSDPILFMWFMKWTAVRLTGGGEWLFTDYIKYPEGVSLLWNTSLVLPSILLTPLMRTWGVLPAYNLCAMAGLVLSAYSAYLFARRFVSRTALCVVAGAVYGFSPFMMAHSHGHLHMTLAFAPPLLGLFIFSWFKRLKEGTVDWRASVNAGAAIGILFIVQMLTGEEILATMCLVAFFALLVAALFYPREIGPALRKGILPGAICLGVFLLPAGYFLFHQFTTSAHPEGLIQPLNVYVTDLSNFVIPGILQWIKNDTTIRIFQGYSGNASENTAYLSLPFVLVLILNVYFMRKNRTVRYFAVMTLLTGILSMGPMLHIFSRNTGIPMPWALLQHLPLMEHVITSRLTMYMFLFCGVLLALGMNALWDYRGKAGKITALSSLGLIGLLYAPALPFPMKPLDCPDFFRNGQIKEYISEGDVVVVAPPSLGSNAQAMYWQAESDMYFRMLGGYAIGKRGFDQVPSTLLYYAYIAAETEEGSISDIPDGYINIMREELKRFSVAAILAGPCRYPAAVQKVFSRITGSPPEKVGELTIWTIPHP